MSCEYIQDLAESLWIDIGEPTSMTPGSVAAQLISNNYIGALSNLIGICYSTDCDGCIVPTLNVTEQNILGAIFLVRYYGRLVARQTGAGGTERIIKNLAEADTRIEYINNSELAKTLAQMQTDAQTRLDALIRSYFDLNKSADVPRGVSFYNII